MFKLWSNPRPPGRRDEDKEPGIDGERMRMLAEHFPIGKKIRYFPEFQRDVVDCVRRAALGPNGQFVRGNAITLISDTCHLGIPSVDTQVDSRLRMKDGPYVDNQMILLRPELDMDGDFLLIKTMDILEIKTGLLNLRF